MQTSLFVFGSLSRGMVHHGMIAQFIEHEEPVSIQGSVYRLEVGFPIFLNDGEGRIQGSAVTLKNFELLQNVLDQFHGFNPMNPEKSLHQRIPIVGLSQDGGSVGLQVYAMNPKKLPKSAKLIGEGDWLSDMNAKPPFTEGLSERERSYIVRLGQCTGRDIVPIQMDLYRNLMNQGIIIDKGRRLALTKLGQEICRYLR